MLHESVHDEVVAKLKQAYSQVRIGDPLESKFLTHPFLLLWFTFLLCKCSKMTLLLLLFFPGDTLYGPLHSEGAVRKFEEAVKEAVAEGGKVEYGGKVIYFCIYCSGSPSK